MGELADDIIDGACCAICGCYFTDPKNNEDESIGYSHDYPVACKDCWEPDCGYQKAEVETF